MFLKMLVIQSTHSHLVMYCLGYKSLWKLTPVNFRSLGDSHLCRQQAIS